MTAPERFDVLIVGSGFGGSLLGTILSRRGRSVAMIDRARHPRFTIGESSTPAADLLLHDLAEQYELPELLPMVRFGTWRATYPQINCGCKRGFSYVWHAADGGYRGTADHRHELLVAASAARDVADTHWFRADVDRFLADVAQQYGVIRLEGTAVQGIEHPKPHDWTIHLEHAGRPRRLSGRFVVDASGPAGLLMHHLAVGDCTGELQTQSSTVYSHWCGVRPLQDWLAERGAAVADFPYPIQDSVIHHVFADGWLWQIPFENGVTSLGYVFADADAARRRPSPEATWSATLRDRPALQRLFGDAQLCAMPGRVFQSGRLQRLRAAGAGADWAALPYTVGFIDALHSTGIAQTLNAVTRLGRILLMPTGRDQAAALDAYSRDVVREVRHIDLFVAGCYAALCDFRLFSAWSMVYFAAATTFERRWREQRDDRPGFLGIDDAEFVERVGELYHGLRELTAPGQTTTESRVAAYCDAVRQALSPYNSVGLFAPAVPNMYFHTAATK